MDILGYGVIDPVSGIESKDAYYYNICLYDAIPPDIYKKTDNFICDKGFYFNLFR